MRFMVIIKANKDTEAGVMPEREAPDRDGELQRGAGEGRRDARGRRAPPELEGGARPVLRRQADRDRRAVRRDQGADRRLLDLAGEVEGRGDRVGQALPQSDGTDSRSRFARSSRRRTSAPSSRPRSASRRSACARRWTRSSRERDVNALAGPEARGDHDDAIHDADDPQGLRDGRRPAPCRTPRPSPR